MKVNDYNHDSNKQHLISNHVHEVVRLAALARYRVRTTYTQGSKSYILVHVQRHSGNRLCVS